MGREKNGFNQTLLFCFLLLFWWFFVPFFGHLTRMPRLPRSMRASSTPNPIVMPNAIFFPLIFRVATVWQCRGKLIESIINDATYERCALRTQRAQWSLIFSPFSNLSWVLVRIPVDWNRFFNTFRFVWYTLWLYRNLHRSPLICAVLALLAICKRSALTSKILPSPEIRAGLLSTRYFLRWMQCVGQLCIDMRPKSLFKLFYTNLEFCSLIYVNISLRLMSNRCSSCIYLTVSVRCLQHRCLSSADDDNTTTRNSK